MKKTNLWATALFVAMLACPLAADADEKPVMGGGMMGQGSMMGQGAMSSMYPQMAEQRKEMMDSMMNLMKETMGILKNLNHSPSADQKKKLDEMMSKLDDMMKKHDAMHEEIMKKMKEKREYKSK